MPHLVSHHFDNLVSVEVIYIIDEFVDTSLCRLLLTLSVLSMRTFSTNLIIL